MPRVPSVQSSWGTAARSARFAVVRGGIRIGDGARLEEHVIAGKPEQGYAVGHVYPGAGAETIIGASAIIRAGAVIYAGTEIGENTVVGHHTLLRSFVTVGSQMQLGHNLTIERATTIGNLVRCSPGSHITSSCAGRPGVPRRGRPHRQRLGDDLAMPFEVIEQDDRADAQPRNPTVSKSRPAQDRPQPEAEPGPSPTGGRPAHPAAAASPRHVSGAGQRRPVSGRCPPLAAPNPAHRPPPPLPGPAARPAAPPSNAAPRPRAATHRPGAGTRAADASPP